MKHKTSCVIIGSFRKFYNDISLIINNLNNLGISVLSPKKSKIINPSQEFVFLESDAISSDSSSIHHIETRVLDHVKKSDFVYLYNPKGYVGLSTAFEVGFAFALGKMIISTNPVSDSTIAEFVGYVISENNLDRLVSLADL